MEAHDVSLKELPTREQKLRRNKDRRESPTLPPIRLRLKSCTSPSHDTEHDKGISDSSMSSSPDSINLHLSPNSAFNSYEKYITHLEPSLPSPLPIMIQEGSLGNVPHKSKEIYSSFDCVVDFDQPLDMSTKRVQNVTLHDSSGNFLQQQQRPSVITCASALLRTQCNLNDINHQMCTVAVADSKLADDNVSQHIAETDNESNKNDVKQDIIRPGHRREIVSGSCDPVIDEHFRRSLGKDYQQIFHKSSANSVSITVDDHFAKALGDTWLQLQSKTSSSSTSQSSQQILHSKQQSQFLQHSPEIVST